MYTLYEYYSSYYISITKTQNTFLDYQNKTWGVAMNELYCFLWSMGYLPPWLQNAYTHSYDDKDYYAIKVWFGLIVFDTSNTIHNILLFKRVLQYSLSFSILGIQKIINFVGFRSYDNTLIMTPSLAHTKYFTLPLSPWAYNNNNV